MEISTQPTDLVVVGAGIVGLSHALEAVERGLAVTVVERDSHAVGASVRNFGHIGVTAQVGTGLELALASRKRWLARSARAGSWAFESGAIVLARSPQESAVLEELGDARGPDLVQLLTGPQSESRSGLAADDVLSAAYLPLDMRVDPRNAVAALAAWLESQPGVRIHWNTAVTGVETGLVRTTRGDIACTAAVVCTGHDLENLMPAVAEEARIERCALQMLLVDPPRGTSSTIGPAVLTGTSMLRYPAMSQTEAAATLRSQLTAARPDLIENEVNLMLTQRPDGAVIVGDSHHTRRTAAPFLDEGVFDLLLDEIRTLLGVQALRVRQRWQGVYAASTRQDVLVATPADRVRAVTVTTGVGMTIAMGLAARVVDDLLSDDASNPSTTHLQLSTPSTVSILGEP